MQSALLHGPGMRGLAFLPAPVCLGSHGPLGWSSKADREEVPFVDGGCRCGPGEAPFDRPGFVEDGTEGAIDRQGVVRCRPGEAPFVDRGRSMPPGGGPLALPGALRPLRGGRWLEPHGDGCWRLSAFGRFTWTSGGGQRRESILGFCGVFSRTSAAADVRRSNVRAFRALVL